MDLSVREPEKAARVIASDNYSKARGVWKRQPATSSRTGFRPRVLTPPPSASEFLPGSEVRYQVNGSPPSQDRKHSTTPPGYRTSKIQRKQPRNRRNFLDGHVVTLITNHVDSCLGSLRDTPPSLPGSTLYCDPSIFFLSSKVRKRNTGCTFRTA